MANDIDLNILLKLVDNASADFKKINQDAIKQIEGLKNTSIQATGQMKVSVKELSDESVKSFTSVNDSIKNFARSTRELGRNITQVGNTISFVSAGILAPFILSLKSASESNSRLNKSFQEINGITSQFRNTVAESLIPMVDKLANIINILNERFNQLSKPLRDSIIQGVFLTGVIGLISGLLITMAGRIVGLVSNMAALTRAFLLFSATNPVLLASIVIIGGIIVAMVKWKGVADVVLNTFEVLFKHLENGFLSVKAAMELFVGSALEGIAEVLAGLASIPGPTQQALTNMSNAVRTTSDDFKILAQRDIHSVNENLKEMGNILGGGSGEWAVAFDGFKQSISSVIADFDKLISKPARLSIVANQIKENVNRALLEMGNTSKKISAIITTTIDSFSAGFGNALGAMIVEGKSFAATMKKLFSDLIKFIIAEFAKLAAIKLIQFVLGKFFHGGGALKASSVTPLEAGSFHSGGFIRAHNGLAVDEVPIIAQTGEGILSRKGMKSLGGEGELSRLNSGQGGTGSIEINVYYPKMSKADEVLELANMLGSEIQK